MAAIAQMNKLRITNPYTHNGWIANPAEQRKSSGTWTGTCLKLGIKPDHCRDSRRWFYLNTNFVLDSGISFSPQ